MAILLVLLAHSLPHAEGGGFGVNIFFTLSGFLITSLLLVEREKTQTVWMMGFYFRRTLRLLPALLLMLALVAALPNPYVHAIDGASMSRWITVPVTLFYVGNFAPALGHPMGYLAHTWSLSVEEQFYFIWPLALLWLASRRRLRRWLPYLILGAVGVRVLLALTGSAGIGNLLPSQADQLLIGALLAVVFLEDGLAWLRGPWVGWLALLILAALALVGSATHQGAQGSFAYYGGITVAGLATASLIGHFVSVSHGWLYRLFTLRPVVWLGRVSYGVYLFHFPIFQWVQHFRWHSRPKELAVEYALMGLAVAVSWQVVERPALRLKNRVRQDQPRAVPRDALLETVGEAISP